MRKEAEAAAKWWREVLGGPPAHDNGDDTQSLMGRLVASRFPELTEEDLRVFEEELARRLNEEIERDRASREETRKRNNLDWPAGDFWFDIGTDYHPDIELTRAVDAAAVRTEKPEAFRSTVNMRLPWKTVMWLRPGKVTVAQGYGAARVAIYTDEEAGSV